MSSGRRVRLASDDPASAGRILALRAQREARMQEERNAADGLTMIDLADSALTGAVDRMHRVRDLVVSGANSQSNPQNRVAMASEIAAIREELQAVANIRNDGRPIFAGFSDVEAVTNGPAGWIYNGDAGAVTRRVGEGDVTRVNVTGDEVFGFTAAQDVFSLLDDIEANLLAGDSGALSASLDDVDTATNRLLAAQASLGSSRNRIEAAMDRNADFQLALAGELAAVEDVDLGEAVMELQIQEMAYQATLGAVARAFPPTLASFLN